MFGFSKKEKEENQKSEAIEHGLDLFGSEFRIALATTADAYGINAYPSGDNLKEERFLTVLVASAFAMGKNFDAEHQTVQKALKNYFSAFVDGNEALNMALNTKLMNRHVNLTEKTFQVWYLIFNHQNQGINIDREELTMSLAQIYLGV
jgi:hypothetical protein